MEVSGRKPYPEQQHSSDDLQPICQPCGQASKHVSARKFCQQCQEFLCETCSEFHKRSKALKSHVLVSVSKGNFDPGTKLSNPPTIKCTVHTEKVIEFYCPAHNVTACNVCAALDHKPCKVSFIPDVSRNYNKGNEYKKLQTELDTLEKEASIFLKETDDNIKKTEESSQNILNELRKFREEMNKYLLSKEKELMAELDDMRRSDVQLLQKAKEDCSRIVTEISCLKNKLKHLEQEVSDLFISSNQMQPRIESLGETLQKCRNTERNITYKFTKNRHCLEIMSNLHSLGSVSKQVDLYKKGNNAKLQGQKETSVQVNQPKGDLKWSKISISRQPDIELRSKKDTKTSYITGIAFLSPNSLLLADFNNNCIKQIDCSTGTTDSYLTLFSQPWDITTLGTDQAVVTLPDEEKLQIISTSSGLSHVRTIAVKGKFRGIDSTEDKFIVSYIYPGKIEILDHYGAVLHCIALDSKGKAMFTQPFYVRQATDRGHEMIYVSDFANNTIIKMSMTGQVLFTYRNKDLSAPEGLAVTGDGHLLVCGSMSHNVQVVSQNGQEVQTLLTPHDSISYPYSVCYNAELCVMYVGCFNSDQLKVYIVKGI